MSSSANSKPGNFDRYVWLLNRLAAMEPREVLHRVVEQQRRRSGKSMQGWSTYWLPEGPLPTLPFDPGTLDRLCDRLQDDWRAHLRQALDGTWTRLGITWPGNTDAEIWHRDPVTEKNWPCDTYCFDIHFRHIADMGDVKYVWELNRLQFLPPIAALARSQGDTRAYDYCLACIESWIDANPPFKGINWVSGIELALRSINLVLSISLIGPDQLPPALKGKLRKALNAHAIWLARYPSKFSSANNHLISEAAALYILGSTMPDLPDAARHRDYGFKTLVQEAEKQILADGVGAEQSPTYTAFTLEWYLLALSVAGGHGKTFPAPVIARLHKAGTHLRWITDSAGNQPRIGDDDEGRVICSGPGLEEKYVSAIMPALAVATDDPSLAAPVTRPHLRDLFLGAAPACPQGPKGWNAFDTGGYTVFRQQMAGRDTMLVFDHGPLGYLSIAAHGHADALSVWLHVDEHPVLIDAGTHLYHSGGSMRDYFRGTSAHNTLTLNDADQSRISGAFNWSRKAKVWRLPMGETKGGPCSLARHDGYKKRFGLVHERRVALDAPDGYLITDRLIGTPKSANLTARVRYFLSPDLDVTQPEQNRVELAIDGAPLVSIEFSFERDGAPCPIRIEEADISPQFGVKTRGQCIVVQCQAYELLHKKIQCQFTLFEKPPLLAGWHSHPTEGNSDDI